MQHSSFMGKGHRLSNGLHQGRRLARGHGSFPCPVSQVPPFHQFHGEVRGPLVLRDFINGNDIWMIQAGSGFRFAAEAFEGGCIGEVSAEQDFQRDNSIEAHLARAVDDAHPAARDFMHKFIIAK
jgi:hypothetical protein